LWTLSLPLAPGLQAERQLDGTRSPIENQNSKIENLVTLKLEIVTPEEKIYSEDVTMVTLPGSEGELGVYPKHVPLLTTLKPGELRVIKEGREISMAVGEGFVEIKADGVSVLTDMALEAEKIDLAAAEAAVERAQAAMKEDHGTEEVAAIQASLQKALAQLHVKRRRHH
jgi:F-type H+-transporting ATPase subunit epsilon